MPSFKIRIRRAARSSGSLVLAADIIAPRARLAPKIISAVSRVADYACAVKLNMHALLPLGAPEIGKITSHAHSLGMQAIADIKLNDIGATNASATQALWSMGFDAVIVNPIMGSDSLETLVRQAHRGSHGVIALAHMSAPEARKTYELRLARGKKLYHNFVKSASSAQADGLVVGATFPKIISECAAIASNVPIYSPGIGAQGGSAKRAAESGTSYFIVGRSILRASNPRTEAARVCKLVSEYAMGNI